MYLNLNKIIAMRADFYIFRGESIHSSERMKYIWPAFQEQRMQRALIISQKIISHNNIRYATCQISALAV